MDFISCLVVAVLQIVGSKNKARHKPKIELILFFVFSCSSLSVI